MAGGPVMMLKHVEQLATSVFVVSVTVRNPGAELGAILKTAVALVAEFMVKETMTMSGVPKLAMVIPWTKWVN